MSKLSGHGDRNKRKKEGKKRRKRCIDFPSGKLKTFLIHGPGHSSDKCKGLGDCGGKLIKFNPNKYRGNHHVIIKIYNKKQENNSIVKSTVGNIILNGK